MTITINLRESTLLEQGIPTPAGIGALVDSVDSAVSSAHPRAGVRLRVTRGPVRERVVISGAESPVAANLAAEIEDIIDAVWLAWVEGLDQDDVIEAT